MDSRTLFLYRSLMCLRGFCCYAGFILFARSYIFLPGFIRKKNFRNCRDKHDSLHACDIFDILHLAFFFKFPIQRAAKIDQNQDVTLTLSINKIMMREMFDYFQSELKDILSDWITIRKKLIKFLEVGFFIQFVVQRNWLFVKKKLCKATHSPK